MTDFQSGAGQGLLSCQQEVPVLEEAEAMAGVWQPNLPGRSSASLTDGCPGCLGIDSKQEWRNGGGREGQRSLCSCLPPWRLAWLESGLAKAGRRHVTPFVLQTAGRKAQEPALSAPNLPHGLLFFSVNKLTRNPSGGLGLEAWAPGQMGPKASEGDGDESPRDQRPQMWTTSILPVQILWLHTHKTFLHVAG